MNYNKNHDIGKFYSNQWKFLESFDSLNFICCLFSFLGGAIALATLVEVLGIFFL